MPHPRAALLAPVVTAAEFAAWESILPLGERRFWQAHAMIYRPGESSAGVHFCLSGTFRAVAFGKSGQQRTLWLMRAHSIIGEISMFTDSSAIYSMECRDAGETVFFSRRQLVGELLPKEPVVSLSIMRLLATKVRMQSEDSQAWNFMPAWKRVGSFLLRMNESPGDFFRIHHADLAEYLGLHRVTVTNAIAHLRAAGLVECRGEGMRVPDPARLEQHVRDGPGRD
ncbi:MAG: Crp/Fnr family transcriptional regulator [Desulfovibrio sp.]|nr:Crp/Fnr family transcriptional regulator [Desulfovibrio sp.]